LIKDQTLEFEWMLQSVYQVASCHRKYDTYVIFSDNVYVRYT